MTPIARPVAHPARIGGAVALSLAALVGCGHDRADHEVRLGPRMQDAAPAATALGDAGTPARSDGGAGAPADAGPRDGGAAPSAGDGGPGLGSIGTIGGGGPRCSIASLPAARCEGAPAASAAVSREVERFLKRVAFANTFIASESADVVRARSIHVGLAERTDARLRVVAAFVADRGGSYRDTRGPGPHSPVDAGATPTCIELVLAAQGAAFVLEPPACVANLGPVPSFRGRPVTP